METTSAPHRLRPVLVFAGLVLIALALPRLLEMRSQAGHLTPPASRPVMQAFSAPQLDGATWRLADHRGQVVLVNFWATWCGPCQRELPGLSALAQTNPAQDLAVLGISLDHAEPAAVRAFVAAHHISYPIARVDPEWQLDQVPSSIPASVLIDRSGRIAKAYYGAIRQRDFQSDIDALLREPR